MIKNSDLKTHRIFSLFSFLLAIYAFGSFLYYNTNNIESIYIYDRVAAISWVFAPLVSVWFFLELTKINNKVIKSIFWGFLVPASIVSFVAVVFYLEELKYFYHHNGNLHYIPNSQAIEYYLYVIYVLSCVAVIIYLLLSWYKSNELNQHRIQAKIFLLTLVSFFLLSFFTNIILPFLETPLIPGLHSLHGLIIIGGSIYSLVFLSGKFITSETIYRLLINHIKEFLFLLDKNGNIYATNIFTLNNLHYNNYEFIKAEPSSLFSSYPQIQDFIKNMGNRTISPQIRVDLITKEGKNIPVLMSIIKIIGHYESIQGYVFACMDYRQMLKLKEEVAERVRTEKNLFQIRRELEFLVKKRTFELQEANQKLQYEVMERKRAEEQIKADLDEKIALVQEVHHRVKNNIQMIISLINMLCSHPKIDQKASDKLREIAEKVRYISRIHEDFYSSPHLSSIAFSKYLKKAIGELYSNYGKNLDLVFKLNIADESLEINQAIPMGIIFNELLLNVFRHAFVDQDNPNKKKIVNVEFMKKQDEYYMIISDNGIGLPDNLSEIKKHKIGLQLVEILTKEHLKGTITNYGTFGTTTKVSFTG